MGTTASQRLGKAGVDPKELSDADVELFRKLQVIVDSCVGVLHREDYLNFDQYLGNEDLRDLSRFLYYSFDAISDTQIKADKLKPFLFRSSILSVFGHIIVNAMTYIKRRALNTASQDTVTDTSQNPFLHVVTGTPGMGKTASRYPFITLLMSFGVETVKTQRAGEYSFVFLRTNKTMANTGRVTCRVSDGQEIHLDVQTYLYYYDVIMYPSDQEPNSQSTSTSDSPPQKKKRVIYTPKGLEDAGAVRLGQLIVPSVECFPHFLRLMIGKTTHVIKTPKPTDSDITVTGPSLLKKFSVIAGGSTLFYFERPEVLNEPLDVVDDPLSLSSDGRMTVSAHSTISKGSLLHAIPVKEVESPQPGQNPQPQTIQVDTQPYYVQEDLYVYPPSRIAEGSILTRPEKKSVQIPPDGMTPLGGDFRIEEGSIIKARSTLTPKSFLVHGYSIQNKLEDTGWHIIDDLAVSDTTNIPFDNHCVLFSSPDGSRWDTTNPQTKDKQYFIAEYVVPKFSLQEEAALLNTMYELSSLFAADRDEHEKALRMFSFVPRFVLQPILAQKAYEKLPMDAQNKAIQARRDEFFGPFVSHKLVHFSCPQFDCHNWYVQFATDEARRFLLDMFNLQASRKYNDFLQFLTKNGDFIQRNGALFHSFVLDAIAGGLHISSPTRFISKEPLDCGHFTLPKTIGYSNIYLRSSTNVLRAYLPDISAITEAQVSPFKPEYDALFKHAVSSQTISTAELERKGDLKKPVPGTIVNTSTKEKKERGKQKTKQPSPESLSESGSDFLSHSEAETPDFKCFTYSLNPLGANNAGFDSLLLFFKVHFVQQKMVVDGLSIIFIQSTLAGTHKISPSGSNLMFMWVALLASVYTLRFGVIFPFLFFVKSPLVENVTLDGVNTTKFFMDERNIWVVNGHARIVGEAERARIVGEDERTRIAEEDEHARIVRENYDYIDRLILDSVESLLPNRNPHHFRCCFCGLILKEDFPNHACERLDDSGPVQTFNRRITSPWETTSSGMGMVGIFDRHNPEENWRRLPGARLMTRTVYTLAREIRQDTLSGRSLTEKCGEYGIHLNYSANGRIPNSHENHNKIDPIDIVLIAPTEKRNDLHPLEHDTSKPEQDNSSFEVTYQAPILNLFSYFPQRQAVVEMTLLGQHLPLTMLPPTVAPSPNRPGTVYPHLSHLDSSCRMVSLWRDKTEIGFERANGQLCVRVGDCSLQPPNMDVEQLYKHKCIPLSQMYVPIDCLHSLPISLYNTRRYLPFEIKCLLAAYTKNETFTLNTLNLSNYLRHGQLVSLEDLKTILSLDILKKPVLAQSLSPLHAHRQSLGHLSMSDFQMLFSYVNGSSLIVANILELFMRYLQRPDQLTLRDLTFLVDCFEQKNPQPFTEEYLVAVRNRIEQTRKYVDIRSSSLIGSVDGTPIFTSSELESIHRLSASLSSTERFTLQKTDDVVVSMMKRKKETIEDTLEIMETLLKNALNIVNEQLRYLEELLIRGRRIEDLSDADRALLCGWFARNPLLDGSQKTRLSRFLNAALQIRRHVHPGTEDVQSNPQDAINMVSHEINSAERHLNALFEILRGDRQVVTEERNYLKRELNKIRSGIVTPIKTAFNTPDMRHRFSWKDLASLLSSPNGSDTPYLSAIRCFSDRYEVTPEDLTTETVNDLTPPLRTVPGTLRSTVILNYMDGDAEMNSTPEPDEKRNFEVKRTPEEDKRF
ncbi:hypothetical protein BLNAU_21499 [Blattamonas nauphoetae]|uniref:Uncharacterized protein n=1 Tax=Blattamonas nauphoetae TaxID=2049346 RepID=A0ABQ9WVN9_9EUKA|nr:hypothetical protein BLNAU_21499 [Blattamonas nauphoetae]